MKYSWPAITKRVVSLNGGSTPVLEQDFAYSNNMSDASGFWSWSQKQTTVTTKDLVRGGAVNSVVAYSYTPAAQVSGRTGFGSWWGLPATPQEFQIVTKDGAGNLAKTETKTWNTLNQPIGYCVAGTGTGTSGVFYQYQPGPTINGQSPIYPTDLNTDTAEYGFGQVAAGTCTRPSSTPPRETITAYTPFSATPIFLGGPSILDRPQSIKIYDNGTLEAETDYTYDQYGVSAGPGSIIEHDECNYGLNPPSGCSAPSSAPRGNATTITQRCNPGGVTLPSGDTCADVSTHAWYDEAGQVTQYQDGNGNLTSLAYTDNFNSNYGAPGSGQTDTYLTSETMPVVNGVSHHQSWTYAYYNGGVVTSTDENSQPTTNCYFVGGCSGSSLDVFGRVGETKYPDEGDVQVSYDDSGYSPSVTTTTAINASVSKTSTAIMDGMGRVVETELTTDPSGADTVKTVYDGLGRIYTQTNPQRSSSSPTDGTTTYTYDALGRTTKVDHPSGTGTEQWCYGGFGTYNSNTACPGNLSSDSSVTWVDYFDETSRHWQREYDAFGRLVGVMEPEASSTPTLQTDYYYDAGNNLKKVDQWGGASGSAGDRGRVFLYDGLSRLMNACNPESISNGSTCSASGPWSYTYTYDGSSNLYTRTDARGIKTTYSYDALNRITQKAYTNDPLNTPTVFYQYDLAQNGWGWGTEPNPETNVVGRLAGVSTAAPYAWIVYGYDQMGRTTLKSECLPGDCGSNHDDLRYKYDLAGNIAFYDRGTDFARNNSNPNQGFYYGGFNMSYDPAGRINGVTADSPDANHPASILNSAVYTPLGGLYQGNAVTIYPFTRTYDHRGRYTGIDVIDSAGQPIWNTTTGYYPNGSVESYTDGYNGSWTYLYGNTNRLAQVLGPSFTLAYTYDHWGNRTSQLVTAGSQTPPTWTNQQYNANNHLTTTWLHDPAGNVTFDGRHQYKYDAENRIVDVDNGTITYIYDGENNRVATVQGSGETRFLYDFQGRLMTELGTNFKATRGNIYVGNELLAEDSPDPYRPSLPTATLLRITDQVGTLRAREDIGANWVGAVSSLPYGDNMVQSGQPSDMAFTGKERDSESGLDYFGARYYNSTRGRFISPDHPFVDQHPDNPQSWNLYAYARNNPLTMTDPTGLGCVTDLGQGSDENHERVEINNSISSDDCAGQHGTWVPGDINKDDIGAYRGSDGNVNFQVTTNTGGNVYYSSFISGAQTDANGVGPGADIAHAPTDWLSSQIVGGSLDQMMSFAANKSWSHAAAET